MGRQTYTRAAYDSAVSSHTVAGKSATLRGEEIVRNTGKLDPLVDPAEYGVVRPSRIRLEDRPDGLFEVPVGAPLTMEFRLDTTGSMGDNVERALRVLPNICELTQKVVPGRDPFYCASIFGDAVDRFILCRGQFEVLAERMVNQLTLMHPEGNGGGNGGEDPHYGLFGAAYLTNAYLHRIGLKSMDFTITDEPCHEPLVANQLVRVFGREVFDKAKENGHEIDSKNLPTNVELVRDLLRRAHAFALLVTRGRDSSIVYHWQRLYGKDRVVIMPEIEYLPQVMAIITGLTEGTVDLRSAVDYLSDQEISKPNARMIVDAVAHIPLGAQRALPNYSKLPKKGDVFRQKTDLWPIDPKDLPSVTAKKPVGKPTGTGGWL